MVHTCELKLRELENPYPKRRKYRKYQFQHVHIVLTLLTMDIVSEILKKSAKNDNQIKEITVEKDIELDIDVGTLLASDYNVFDNKSFR